MEGNIVVFGTPPNKPETGYGYIKTARNSQQIQKVISFQEKPDITTALSYLKENQNPNAKESYFWNSGMFMFQVKTYLNELKKHAPEIFQTSLQAFENAKRGDFIQLKSDDMQEIPNISVDYAVMEKSDKIKVVISDIEWNDIGSFDSLDEVLEKDENNNTKNETLIVQNSKNNFVVAKHNKMIALNDIEDLIIVDTPSALLVSKKGASQQIKEMVKKIKEKNPELAQFGKTVYRPWGNFTNLYEFDSFKVKTLVVKPGKRLSLQKHMHRSEHWVVVRGTATITLDEREFLLTPNESTYISIGVKHRLSNLGKIPLEVVEVQVGEYLKEDDIIRYSDDFGRN